MMRRRVLLHAAAGCAGALALPAWSQADKKIRLGQSAPMTGPAAQLGVQMNHGAKLYFDRVNEKGGIGGRSIDLRVLDDGYEPDRCRANTETFIEKDDVFGLFGYVGTPTSLAALPLVNSAKIPFFGPFTGAQALREPSSRWVFHVRASYFAETAVIVKQLVSLGQTRIAVFRQNDSYGQAGLDGVTRALKTHKHEVAAVGLVERNSQDVSKALEVILAAQPHAVVQISAYKSCAAFVRAARKAGFGGGFFNVSFVGTQALADELGADGRGVVVSQVMPYPFSTTTAISREYLDAVKAAGGNATPNYSSMEGYVAAKVFCEGLRRAGGNASRDALVNALEGMQHYDAGGYMLSFNSQDHQGSSFVDLSMLTGDGKVRR